MKEFERLEKHIALLKKKDLGHWVFPEPEMRNGEKINFFPYVQFSETVSEFLHDFHKFYNANDSIYNASYEAVLNEYGLYRGECNFEALNLSLCDARCVGAMVFCIIRNDRFCEGVLLEALESGFIVKCLKRLKEIAQTELLCDQSSKL